MKVQSIRVDDIVTGERHRALSGDAVERLAESMKALGLRQPISIRLSDNVQLDDGPCDGVPVLVAGAHRLAAAKGLGWSHIDCIEVEDDPVQAELWEIAENLHRCDLTKEQRDQHIRRYAELLETQREILRQSGAVLPKRGPGQPKGVASQIAEETGLSKRTVERVLNPPTPRLLPDIKPVLEPESDHDAIIREANAIVSAWNRARQEARDLALSQIDGPVFDRSRAA